MKLLAPLLALGAVVALSAQNPPPAQQQPSQPSSIGVVIGSGDPKSPPRMAVPEFIPLGKEPEVVAAAKTIADVLWDDFAYEKEFYMIPRDILRSIPRPASVEQVALERWKEVNAEGLVVGTVRKTTDRHRRRAPADQRRHGRAADRQAVQRFGTVGDRRRPRLRPRHRRRNP